MTEVKQFTSRKNTDPIPFEVDGETFHLLPNVPGTAVLDVAGISEAKGLDTARIIMRFLDQVMVPESAARFAARLGSSEDPITIETGIEVATWALGVVTNSDRPTEPSSQSSNGSGPDGASSEGGASPTASTSAPSTGRVL
jgi:hypothetical protein